MCLPAGPMGEDISLLIKTVQSRLVAAVKHDSIDTASELLRETLVQTCKEAGWSKARCRTIKINANPTKQMVRSGMRNRKRKLAIP